ncbi:MAG: hypothetical protein AB7N76_00525 [Planctomycetota bacterium]
MSGRSASRWVVLGLIPLVLSSAGCSTLTELFEPSEGTRKAIPVTTTAFMAGVALTGVPVAVAALPITFPIAMHQSGWGGLAVLAAPAMIGVIPGAAIAAPILVAEVGIGFPLKALVHGLRGLRHRSAEAPWRRRHPAPAASPPPVESVPAPAPRPAPPPPPRPAPRPAPRLALESGSQPTAREDDDAPVESAPTPTRARVAGGRVRGTPDTTRPRPHTCPFCHRPDATIRCPECGRPVPARHGSSELPPWADPRFWDDEAGQGGR